MGKAIKKAESEVIVSRRGRVATFDPELLEDLTDLQVGEMLDLSPYFGTADSTEQRQKVGAEIRKHWKAVRSDECRLDFGKGIPQVRVK